MKRAIQDIDRPGTRGRDLFGRNSTDRALEEHPNSVAGSIILSRSAITSPNIGGTLDARSSKARLVSCKAHDD